MTLHLSLFDRRPRRRNLAALCITATFMFSDPVLAQKISRDLTVRTASETVEAIVQYKVEPTEEHHAKIARLGGRLHNRMDFIKAAHYSPKPGLSRNCPRIRR